MWYLLHVCFSLVTLVNPFFRPVQDEASHQIFMSLLPPVVGFLLNTWLTKGGGGHRHSRTPPWLRPWWACALTKKGTLRKGITTSCVGIVTIPKIRTVSKFKANISRWQLWIENEFLPSLGAFCRWKYCMGADIWELTYIVYNVKFTKNDFSCFKQFIMVGHHRS